MEDVQIIKEIKAHPFSGSAFPDETRDYIEELYKRYYSQCYNISRYYGMKKHDAEEVVQDSFIKVLKRIGSFDDSRPFKPYLFKIVLNTVRDKYRENFKHSHASIDSLLDEPSEEQQILIDSFHTKSLFHSIIIKMPEKVKEVVLLRNFSGLLIEEISEVAGVGRRQIHNLLNKGYEIIKRGLEEENK